MQPNTVTPSAGQVDYTQDPNDFAALATGKTEITPPVDGNSVEKPAVPDPNAGHSQDNGEKTPDEQKPEPAAAKKPETNEANPPAAPPKLTAEQFAKKEADKKISEMGAEKKRLFMAAVEMVKSNPVQLETIAKYDKSQADAIAKELYGYDSAEDYQSHVRIETLRETDPEKAQTEERLFALEKELKITRSSTQEQLEKTFFEGKKLSYNPLSTEYQVVKDKLKYLDPTFVKNNYLQALALAYDSSYGPSGVPAKSATEQAINESMSEGGGNAESAATQAEPSTYSEPQSAFASMVGAKLT